MRCSQLFAWFDPGDDGAAHHLPASLPLARGSVGHVGLAHLYARQRAVQQREDPEAFYTCTEAMALTAARFGRLGASVLPTATRMVRDYAHHYGTESFAVIGVERLHETVFHGYRYTARVDLELEDNAGRVWFYDHKLVHRIDSKVLHRYTLSGQFLGLAHLGARLHGERFGGIRLNLLSALTPAFLRVTPEPAPYMLARFPEVVRYAEEGIARVRALKAAGEVIPASPSEHTCMTSYGPCPAFELCRWGQPASAGRDPEEILSDDLGISNSAIHD